MARETLTYDASNGFLTGTSLGSVTDSFGYSAFGELEQYSADFLGSIQFSTHYVRDKLERIQTKTETVNGTTSTFDYDYDVAGRLIEVQKDSVIQNTYTYDTNGNRQNNGAAYDDQDRLTSNNTATYSYTANGELLTKVDASGTTTYTYDVLGNLMSVQLPSGDLIEYVVDGSNRRLAKLVNGTPERAWVYKDGLNPVAELDGAGVVTARFVYGTKSNIPDHIIKGGVTYRIISDHLGSPRLVIDTTTGAVAQELDYDEWGVVTTDTNPDFQPFAFAGGLYDTDTKLVRFGARDYDSEIGRWTIKDPIRFAGSGTNFFGYSVNDPLNNFDPTGLHDRPFPFNGVIRNRSNREIIIVDIDSETAKTLKPGDSSSYFFEDQDFIVDEGRTTKVGPNFVQVEEDGTVTDLTLLPGSIDPKRKPNPASDTDINDVNKILCAQLGIKCTKPEPEGLFCPLP